MSRALGFMQLPLLRAAVDVSLSRNVKAIKIVHRGMFAGRWRRKGSKSVIAHRPHAMSSGIAASRSTAKASSSLPEHQR